MKTTKQKDMLQLLEQLKFKTTGTKKVLKALPSIPTGFEYKMASDFIDVKNPGPLVMQMVPKQTYIKSNQKIRGMIEITITRSGDHVVANFYDDLDNPTVVCEVINDVITTNTPITKQEIVNAYLLSDLFASNNKLHTGTLKPMDKSDLSDAIDEIATDIYGNKSDKFKIEVNKNSTLGMIHPNDRWGDVAFDPLDYLIMMNTERVVADVAKDELLDSIDESSYASMRINNNKNSIEITLTKLNEDGKPVLHFVGISNEYNQDIEEVVGSGQLRKKRLAKFYLPKLKEYCQVIESELEEE